MTSFGRRQTKYSAVFLPSKIHIIDRQKKLWYAYLIEMEVDYMRILLKILLFPITLMVSIILLVCQFVCVFSSMLLSILAFFLFALGFAAMVFLGDTNEGLTAMFIAYLISPYGIPLLAAWLLGTMGGINERLKSI
ncbi:hypothetical protein BD821_12140 [Clostridium algidicarnis DSM 15099]|uniref:Uncharacterized protein n=2 Tax=Clostridium algidicarnis TaxID=37659 RepID=A0A2S6FV34_9CLOT|nr:hypothetical protein BD821_12140 [Clostridium algidicarnis DSM 15099]